ncbi:ImmA/IrrE family metallo-endopeptidase [Hathewaya massiliensis]|uniref:ImmA/IrrE family metallo-endopeptidase n=1 Tax=Hathewaya massiliensis TaxID=1964382 RepID=UPI001157AF3A|nr:ImmA/IrrE family metallo-endopeptidase [Hathewaya massiliensis]
MVNVDVLFDIVEKENIQIEYVKLPKDIQGIYYKAENLPPIIGINRNIINNAPLFKTILAEEIGHHFTTFGDTTAECFSYIEKLLITKKENLALKWATDLLIPTPFLVQAIQDNISTIYDLAEFFCVTEDFIRLKLYFINIDSKAYTYCESEIRRMNYDSCNL